MLVLLNGFNWLVSDTGMQRNNSKVISSSLGPDIGAVAWVLHAAAVDPTEDGRLQAWGLQALRQRQR